MGKELKHSCHECGGYIAYPQGAFGATATCPHCGQETTLGEIYPSAPASPRSRHSISSTPPPPPVRTDTTVPHKALKRPAHVDKLKLQPRTESSSARSGWIGGSVILIAVLLFNFGGAFWNTYLQTDKAAIALIRKSMLETFNSQSELKKPVEILQLSLAPGSNDSRSGSAVVTLGGEAETIQFKVKITRSFGRDLKVEWQVEEQKTDSGKKTDTGTLQSARLQLGQHLRVNNDPLFQTELQEALYCIEQVESTEETVAEVWNGGIRKEVGGLAQLKMIRDQIVPLIREAKNRVEQFRPSSVKLQPVKSAMLELVQHDFSSWISINNAAAVGNWSAARSDFDRMEITRKVYARKLNAAIETLTNR